MLLVFSLAGAAALTVVAYTRLRARSPEAAAAAVAAVKQLAAVVLVCAKAVEAIVDALIGARTRPVYVSSRSFYEPDLEEY
jgi:hypothetical protein